MIPGDLAARKASVVVCNGGAGTGYQALAEGTPIVGTR
jgi:UDP:flavonoid glycosyltransferase YjiC (YdhE family)